MSQPPVVEQQIILPVTPDELWVELTDPGQIGSWFGATVEWELVPGGLARFQDEDGSERTGVVDTVRPAHELRFRWWRPGEQASEVHYLLERVDDGTRLTVIERGLPDDDEQGEDPATPQASATWSTRLIALWLARSVPVPA
jgi:uncharacterized protein YndB with AHSA1/START domain